MARALYAFLSLTFCLGSTYAAVLLDENLTGDISNDYLNPDRIELSEGSNLVSGTLLGGGFDVDLFSFTVPEGFIVITIIPTSFVGGGNGSFLGIQMSDVLTASPSSAFPDPIGHTLFNANTVSSGTNILPIITSGPPFGSVTSLPAGTYAAWLNEIDSPSIYTLDFEVVAVPEPHLLLQSSFAFILFSFRRKRIHFSNI